MKNRYIKIAVKYFNRYIKHRNHHNMMKFEESVYRIFNESGFKIDSVTWIYDLFPAFIIIKIVYGNVEHQWTFGKNHVSIDSEDSVDLFY